MLPDPRSRGHGRKLSKSVLLTAALLGALCAIAGCGRGETANQSLNAPNNPALHQSPTPTAISTTPVTVPTPAVSTPPPDSQANPPGSPVDVRNLPNNVLQAQAQNHTASLPSPAATPSPTPKTSTHAPSPAPRTSTSRPPTPKPSTPAPPIGGGGGPVRGIDVSAAQGAVNWSAVRRAGARFAYIKATEGSYYTNPDFSQQYEGAFKAGIIRGAYVFAVPNFSGGAAQANYLVAHGGGWSADGLTLPAALDIEYNPYPGTECYNLSQSAMRAWVNAFLNQYHARTGRWATIYTTTDWWSTCTGDWSGPSSRDPLWIARYGVRSPGTLLAGYRTYTIWQYQAAGSLPGDQDWFNGSLTRLEALAKNS